MSSNLLEWGRKLWRGLVEGLAASVPTFYRIVLDAWRVPTEEERRKAAQRHKIKFAWSKTNPGRNGEFL